MPNYAVLTLGLFLGYKVEAQS